MDRDLVRKCKCGGGESRWERVGERLQWELVTCPTPLRASPVGVTCSPPQSHMHMHVAALEQTRTGPSGADDDEFLLF
jgi:hypothetical protein